MLKTHPTYDENFRREAVDLLLSSGRPLKQVAEELGVAANSLRSWRNCLRLPRFQITVSSAPDNDFLRDDDLSIIQ